MTYKTDMSKERDAFERALMDLAEKHRETLCADDFSRDLSGSYDNGATEIAWMLWQARAALSPNTEDMATASAQGFRDGVASLAASAGSEPVAKERFSEPLARVIYAGYLLSNCAFNLAQRPGTEISIGTAQTLSDCRKEWDEACAAFKAHPSPPEGMVMVPKEPTEAMLDAVDEEVGGHCYSCSKWRASYDDCRRIWAAMIAAAQPTSSADSGKGE